MDNQRTTTVIYLEVYPPKLIIPPLESYLRVSTYTPPQKVPTFFMRKALQVVRLN